MLEIIFEMFVQLYNLISYDLMTGIDIGIKLYSLKFLVEAIFSFESDCWLIMVSYNISCQSESWKRFQAANFSFVNENYRSLKINSRSSDKISVLILVHILTLHVHNIVKTLQMTLFLAPKTKKRIHIIINWHWHCWFQSQNLQSVHCWN